MRRGLPRMRRTLRRPSRTSTPPLTPPRWLFSYLTPKPPHSFQPCYVDPCCWLHEITGSCYSCQLCLLHSHLSVDFKWRWRHLQWRAMQWHYITGESTYDRSTRAMIEASCEWFICRFNAWLVVLSFSAIRRLQPSGWWREQWGNLCKTTAAETYLYVAPFQIWLRTQRSSSTSRMCREWWFILFMYIASSQPPISF